MSIAKFSTNTHNDHRQSIHNAASSSLSAEVFFHIETVESHAIYWEEWGISAVFFKEGPSSRSYGRTAALRLIVQPCDEDGRKIIIFLIFLRNGAPVE
jgi:hypothetical protein